MRVTGLDRQAAGEMAEAAHAVRVGQGGVTDEQIRRLRDLRDALRDAERGPRVPDPETCNPDIDGEVD